MQPGGFGGEDAVGGVADGDFEAYARAGVTAFGLGSSLFKPGLSADEVGIRARAAVAAWDRVFPSPGGSS